MWEIGDQIWLLAARMAPYLLFGFLVSSFLYGFVPSSLLERRLGRGLGSVALATIIGAPLPLCSCSVLPVAISLRQRGASAGAVAAFLIATPITSIDSLLATYAFFGLSFTLYRLLASLFVAFLAGAVTHFLTKTCITPPSPVTSCNLCHNTNPHSHSLRERLGKGVLHGFWELPREIGKWILLGIILGGLITVLLPREVGRMIGGGVFGPPVLLVMGLPLYVCSTGSVPVAAGFVNSGFTLGSALVFLLVGPATNIVPLITLWRVINTRFVLGLVLSVAAGSLFTAYLLDFVAYSTISADVSPLRTTVTIYHKIAGLVLLGLILVVYLQKIFKNHRGHPEKEISGSPHCCRGE